MTSTPSIPHNNFTGPPPSEPAAIPSAGVDLTTPGHPGLPGPDRPQEIPDHLSKTALIKPGYDPRLTNEDLAPLIDQNWSWYNIFAFWMSDVHSVGGYVTAGSLFALGLTSWQVFVCLIIGITIVLFFANLIAKPSQRAGVPYPVICRSVFGVMGANIPAIIRGLIAVAWYGIQTYLASAALDILVVRLWPSLAPYGVTSNHGLFGLSYLGYGTFALLWVAQAAVFWTGMKTIRKFIDFAGPAVYVVMIALCVYLMVKAHGNISLNLSSGGLGDASVIGTMCAATALVVSYFSGPMLNFGDFSRYARSFKDVKKGNFWGLPVNFLFFSILTVLTASATIPVYGKLITDPVATVGHIDNTFAIVLAALTFTTATIGINIVANFVSPAFDFSNVNPQKISWRTGGMIAAVCSVLLTPWNLYKNPEMIHYTLDTLGAFIGPLFGVLLAHFYIVHRQKVCVDDLFTLEPSGAYHYHKGYNPSAIIATAIAAACSLACVFLPVIKAADDYSWFVGCGIGLLAYAVLAPRMGVSEERQLTGKEVRV
ncbi:NCS1 family nucleobase:cation symporter-1 [Leekyejoonella antrihumi]|uniref:NCS1 family nucleobase:cation symporter-1 n=1 Tax=Leekyejoonella antrihumi TaxID=1660198 RepID=A0A563DYY5_9MICO|nr:NCS1 family nucleobase:cation symporter-1 [Leekyejoonella antrihumi]TWP35436.1 NCS1 family nucleobase:cation symporter-1 [Leekyejoonella antrihumi]